MALCSASSRVIGECPLNRRDDLRRADGLQQEFVPLMRPGWERKGMPGNHEGLGGFFASQVRYLQPITIRESHVRKHKIIPTGSQEIGTAAHRSGGIDLISGIKQHMLDEEPQRRIILDH